MNVGDRVRIKAEEPESIQMTKEELKAWLKEKE